MHLLGRRRTLLAIAVCALVVAGCGPTIVVANHTSIPVTVIVTSNGKSDVLSPSPGESSASDASEGGYSVVVLRDTDWIAYATATRKYLNDQLANSDSLTGAQLLEVVGRLKDIVSKIDSYRQAGANAGCSGAISNEGGGSVIVSQAADGPLVATCK